MSIFGSSGCRSIVDGLAEVHLVTNKMYYSGLLTNGTPFAQNHQLIIGGPSAANPACAFWIFCYSSRAIWHDLMTLKHCLILWLAILSFTYKHLYRHTHTHIKSLPNLQPELVRRERGLGIWAKGLCSPYWFVTQQVELSFHGVVNMYLTRIITKCELLNIIFQLQNEPTCLWNCLFVFGGNICCVSSIWQVSM